MGRSNLELGEGILIDRFVGRFGGLHVHLQDLLSTSHSGREGRPLSQ